MESTVRTEPPAIHLVTSTDSPEFAHLDYALTHSSVVALDAEWKPNRQASTFPTVSLLQIACRLIDSNHSPVFLLDLHTVHLPSVYELVRHMFVSADVLKLGFRFKQDLIYLSSTFSEQACEPGFEIVEPYIDINAIYHYLQTRQPGYRMPKQAKSLATICTEILGISLSKELQCSDWSQRPLTKEQKTYAALDALCLLDIFSVFYKKIVREGKFVQKPILQNDAQTIEEVDSLKSSSSIELVDGFLLWIIRKYGDKILLTDSDRKPKSSQRKAKKSKESQCKPRITEIVENWQGPPPWDPSVGGDGCAKFLCDVMVEGLAKHLRCVGIDAAVPYLKKPETRELINQAQKEQRVLLTRDAKLFRHEYLIKNQLYRVKSLLKNEQLLEIIETFQLRITEDQLMSRCTKCNGSFIQKPLTTEEAVEASKGFQVIPNCLFNRNLEFWQCMDCNQLYWEGTQYHNAVQKFVDVCKLN